MTKYLTRAMRIHVCPQKRVDLRLVSAPLSAEPFQHVGIQAQRDLLLGLDRFQTPPRHHTCKHLRCHLGDVGKIDVLVVHGVETLPVSLRSI